MEVQERDVVRLANAISMKADVNIHIVTVSQCTSDFILALYLSIMGELPPGVLTDCVTVNSQVHNIGCILETLANEYLQVDLSHISPHHFVAGDATTVLNLLEILDGVLDFMLEQISPESDSGDEGDDEMSCRNQTEKQPNSDLSTCTADLINLNLSPNSLPRENIAWEEGSPHQVDPSKLDEVPTFDATGLDFVPLQGLSSPTAQGSQSHEPAEWVELQPTHDTTNPVCDISEHTLDSTSVKTPQHNEELAVPDRVDDVLPRPMLIDSLKNPDEADGSRILEDMTNSLRHSLRSTYKVGDKPEPTVVLDTSIRGSGISISDVTSESSKAESSLSVGLDTGRQRMVEIGNRYARSSDGDDVHDGIPKPELGGHDRPTTPIGSHQPDNLERRLSPPSGDWEGLLNNLQKTVEESKRVREKYFSSPTRRSENRESEEETEDTTFKSLAPDTSGSPVQPKRRNVRFEDTASVSAKQPKDFKKVLKKEKQLQTIKKKILANNFCDHLEEVEEAERRKMKPLVWKAKTTEVAFKNAMNKPQGKKGGKASPSSVKKSLAEAAKWKSWQTETVVYTPKRRLGRVQTRLDGRMVLGEHDLLPTLMSEFPGMQLSATTLNNAWTKQFREIERLTRAQDDHVHKKRRSEKQLHEAHNRHQLLIDIMRREHEQTERIRGVKEQTFHDLEATRRAREKRQQSARVRRYYRDYQLQMRSRMLKRRTREEKLFKNLFEEGLNIQKSRLNDLRRYARDQRQQQLKRQRNEIASLENYYADQFGMLADALRDEKASLQTRERAQNTLLCQMKAGLRRKMEHEVQNLQEQIARDDDDIYFRELEADRIRRQLQLATYNAKYSATIAK